jgi:hypothetical protein
MSGNDSDSSGGPAPPSPTRRPGSGRPARGATGRGDGRIAVAYSPLAVQATGRRRATPAAAAARDARREAGRAGAGAGGRGRGQLPAAQPPTGCGEGEVVVVDP